MAACAIRGEAGQCVVRIHRRGIIRHMATGTYRGGICEVACRMATSTILYGMSTCQREEIVVRKIGRPTRAHRIVTVHAILRETGTRMVRVLRSHIVGLVAIDTVVPEPCESERVVGHMTVHAAQIVMRADQRETVLLVQFRDIIHQPGPWCVTSRTIIAYGHRVHVGVASHTISRNRRIESQRTVAGAAINFSVQTDQRKCCGIVIETQWLPHRRPIGRYMARRAIDHEALTVRRLTESGSCMQKTNDQNMDPRTPEARSKKANDPVELQPPVHLAIGRSGRYCIRRSGDLVE